MSNSEKQERQASTNEQGHTLNPPDQTRASTVVVAGGSSITSSLHTPGAEITPRRQLYVLLVENDHQLQLTLKQAEKVNKDLSDYIDKNQYEDAHSVMVWYRDHLNDLSDIERKRIEWMRAARQQLDQLIEEGDIRDGTFLKPQPKKYTKRRMELEIGKQTRKLGDIRTQLLMAEAAWDKLKHLRCDEMKGF